MKCSSRTADSIGNMHEMPVQAWQCCCLAGAVQSEQVSSNPPQGTHTGRDASVTGQALQSPAVAGRAGAAAAAMGASIQQPDEAAPMQLDDQPVQLVEPAAQKALPAALMVMFKKNSIVNLQDVRSACICCLTPGCTI